MVYWAEDRPSAMAIKHYRFRDGNGLAHPAALFEVRVALRNYPLGTLYSDWIFYRGVKPGGQVVSDYEVSVVHAERLLEIQPPGRRWPAFDDQNLIECLGRQFRRQLWRNYQLGLFSEDGESQQEFIARCRKELYEERWRELSTLRDVFLHRFFEMEQRLEKAIASDLSNPNQQGEKLAQARSLFSEVRQGLSRWLLQGETDPLGADERAWKLDFNLDFQERIDQLRQDFFDLHNRIHQDFENRATSVEPYPVSLATSLKIISRSVLWE